MRARRRRPLRLVATTVQKALLKKVIACYCEMGYEAFPVAKQYRRHECDVYLVKPGRAPGATAVLVGLMESGNVSVRSFAAYTKFTPGRHELEKYRALRGHLRFGPVLGGKAKNWDALVADEARTEIRYVSR